jgi:hypothetical protein
MAPGAINAKGQKKVVDPKDGTARWIDMKSGMVQGPSGAPIKQTGRDSSEPEV